MKIEEYQDMGRYLSDVRESLNITLEKAAKDLNIKQKHLFNIENGIIDDAIEMVYLRGFIRKYANYLKLDEALILNRYNKVQKKENSYFIPKNSDNGNMPSFFTIIICFLCIGLAFYLYNNYSNGVNNKTEIMLEIPNPPKIDNKKLADYYFYNAPENIKQCLNSYSFECYMNLRFSKNLSNFMNLEKLNHK